LKSPFLGNQRLLFLCSWNRKSSKFECVPKKSILLWKLIKSFHKYHVFEHRTFQITFDTQNIISNCSKHVEEVNIHQSFKLNNHGTQLFMNRCKLDKFHYGNREIQIDIHRDELSRKWIDQDRREHQGWDKLQWYLLKNISCLLYHLREFLKASFLLIN
jgi:hypothetical protein